MDRRRLRTLIGVAMVGIGLVQVGTFTVQRAWIPAVLGLLYSIIGIAYLWAEVYAVDS